MNLPRPIPGIDRRQVLAGAAALAGAGSLPLAAQDKPTLPAWDEPYRKIIGTAKPLQGADVEGKLLLEIPEIAENGNLVPFTLAVDAKFAQAKPVRALHLIATANPQPLVASFRFGPASGRALATSRMRLAQTQDVLGLAEFADGSFMLAKRTIKVTIGGCGG